jgi:hypothetical protein
MMNFAQIPSKLVVQTQLLLSSNSKLQTVQASANGGWSKIPFEFVGLVCVPCMSPLVLNNVTETGVLQLWSSVDQKETSHQ